MAAGQPGRRQLARETAVELAESENQEANVDPPGTAATQTQEDAAPASTGSQRLVLALVRIAHWRSRGSERSRRSGRLLAGALCRGDTRSWVTRSAANSGGETTGGAADLGEVAESQGIQLIQKVEPQENEEEETGIGVGLARTLTP